MEVSESNDDAAKRRRKTGDGGDDAEEVGRQLSQQTPPEDGTADWTLAVLVRGRFQKSLKTANAREAEDDAGS